MIRKGKRMIILPGWADCYNQVQSNKSLLLKLYCWIWYFYDAIFQMIAQFYSWLCCEPRPEFPDPYSFTFGGDSAFLNRQVFQSNEIKTTKYNLLNFLPKSVLTQYQRLANLYFLLVAIIASIPEVTPLSPAIIWTPLTIVLFISILKELYQDYSRFRTDREINSQKQVTVVREGKLQNIKWKDLLVGDVCRIQDQEIFPADILLISSSDKDGVAFIETATLDGQQTSKVRYAFHQLNSSFSEQTIANLEGKFEGEPPNSVLSHFRGMLEVGQHRLSINDSGQLLFRGARLKRTKWIWGVTVYTGQCSKIMMNGQSFVSKLSTVERKLNYLLITMLIVQLVACFVMSSLSTSAEMRMRDTQDYTIWRKNFSKTKLFVMNFLLFFVEYSSLIPVSLIVSIEIAKAAQSYFIDFDQLMFSDWRKRKAYARIAALNEELGQIEYVFCDKTGTLTKNQLKFHTAVIGDQFYEFKYNGEKNTYICNHLKNDIGLLDRQCDFLSNELLEEIDSPTCRFVTSDFTKLMEEYFMCLLVCNNVSTVEDDAKNIIYQSESPDELAIIEMAKNFGFRFLKRDKSSILVEINRQIERIEMVETFPFSSERKRMSVIIKWRGSYLLYAKGADNVILERAVKPNFQIEQSVDRLCKSGLRSLLVGARQIRSQRVDELMNLLRMNPIESRQEILEEYGNEFQRDLKILGATGLLDELQDQVPETLRDLQRADIRVWMLTGDKLETAIEIGKACNLIGSDYEVVLFKKTSKDVRTFIRECQISVRSSLKVHALVVQGSVLTSIFNDQELSKEFAELTIRFASVICCRMLPVQKSQAVRMIKTHLKKICLAIGDGGNDVSMIKEANIGIGLYGEEGMSAVQACDYAIPEFKMVWRLLFVHGRWNYMRICEMILYFAYKSIIFTVPRFLFSFFNSYSGQPIYDDFYQALYNVVFTALPLLVRALFEQDINYIRQLSKDEEGKYRNEVLTEEAKHLPKGYRINEAMRKLFPKIYFVGQKNQIFNIKQCLVWTSEAILMGISLFFIVEKVFGSVSFRQQGLNSNLPIISITIYTSIIMVDTLKLCMLVRHWTKLLLITILFFSIAPYLAFIWVLNYRFKRPVQGILTVYFTSIKTYLSILAIVLILVAINGILIYIRFHSSKILNKMTIALKQDQEMASIISTKNQKGSKRLRYSQDNLKPRSNKVIDEKMNENQE